MEKKCATSCHLGLITIQFANVCNRFLGEARRKSPGEIIFGVNIISGDQETPHAAEAITTVNPFVREPFTPFIGAAQPLSEVTQLE